MIGNGRVLAVITARGGSKGIPGKNVVPFRGRPLIDWTVAAARASAYVDRVILSSDDAAIGAAATAAGCEVPFVRPAHLASDTARSIDVLHHAMAWATAAGERSEYVVLLQPTSPLRSAQDIDACIEACARSRAPAAVTVARASEPPHWMFTRDGEGRLSPLLSSEPAASRRQDLPACWLVNGAVYVARWSFIATSDTFFTPDTRGVEMPPERSVDIDTPLDLRLAELLAADLGLQ